MQQNDTKKKAGSITRKLFHMLLGKLFGSFLITDITLVSGIVTGWTLYQITDLYGGFPNELAIEATGDSLQTLQILFDDGVTLYTVTPFPAIQVFGVAFAFVLGTQLLTFLGALCFDFFRIRKRLKPLRDVATAAQAIADQTWNTQKFQNLEYAINHVDADAPYAQIAMGDRDLAGIEASLNDLLNRMRQANLQQVRFVSDASHELRTPIAVIKGYADLLDRWGKEDVQTLEEGISAIKNEADHMNTLVEQLLFLARGDSGRNKPEFLSFPLSDMVKEVYEESRMIDSKHDYELQCPTGDILCYGDVSMLKQSMRILVDNAAKYTTEGDTITLRCGVDENYRPYFTVQDNGIGMGDSDLIHIFDRFYRSDQARNSQTGGTGLGLSIAKWIIDRHHGAIKVTSRPEIGTRFTVFLNVNEEHYQNAVRI